MKVLLLTGLGALFFAYYWDDNFDPGGLDYLVLNHIGGAPAGTRARSPQATRWLMQVNFLSYVQLTSRALPSLTDSKGSLVVVSSLLGRVPTSFSTPYSAAKFALDGFFGSLRRELDVQDVNVAITMCVLGLRDRASAAEAVRSSTSRPRLQPEHRGVPLQSQTAMFLPPTVPGARTLTETPLRGWPPKMKSSRQKSKTQKNDGHLEPVTASEVQVPRVRCLCRGLASPHLFGHD
uniref:Hydroxysteroid 11-beta-dehydrogenase 1-like protein n=1 Tax=Pongo abelii TaxID=9601 RepID=A0A8I5TLD2_PONAB